MRISVSACFFALVAISTAPAAQDRAGPEPATAPQALDPERGAELARALVRWAEAFDRRELDPRGRVRSGTGEHPIYGTTHEPNRELGLLAGEGLEHIEALTYLIFAIEPYEGDPVAAALLRVAGVGLDRPLADRAAAKARDTAHFALLRKADRWTWPMLVRVVSGVRAVDEFGALWSGRDERREDEDRLVLPALRVAALRALGEKNLPAFRGVVEHALVEADPRVRLAAAQALRRMKHRRSLAVLARSFASEPHPTVAEEMLRAIDRIIQSNLDRLHPDRIQQTTRSILRAVGRIGWRTDVGIVRLAESYPCREVVPAFIRILRESTVEDTLLSAVNARAHDVLRARALLGLRRVTGAIEPEDTPESWERFWVRERGKFRFDELPKPRVAPKTSASFFGIPVTGEEFAFVVDTSGSMREPCEYGRDTRSRSEAPPMRLDVAKDQMLKAVHAMDRASRYHLITFASDVTRWNDEPVPPHERSHASLTGLLGRIQPGGGTNLSGALEEALDPGARVFGQQRVHDVDEVFVLSDGQPSAGLTDPDAILELVQLVNPEARTRIHVVFAGNHGAPGEDLLQRMAAANDGVFVRVN